MMSNESAPFILPRPRPGRRVLAAAFCVLTALGFGSFVQAAPAVPACSANSRMLDGQMNRPAGATRVCSGETFTAYAREIVRYQSLGVRIEIWAVKGDGQALRTPLLRGLSALGYRLKGEYPNGEQKYVTAMGRGVRISEWKEAGSTYFMLFLF